MHTYKTITYYSSLLERLMKFCVCVEMCACVHLFILTCSVSSTDYGHVHIAGYWSVTSQAKLNGLAFSNAYICVHGSTASYWKFRNMQSA